MKISKQFEQFLSEFIDFPICNFKKKKKNEFRMLHEIFNGWYLRNNNSFRLEELVLSKNSAALPARIKRNQTLLKIEEKKL